VLFALLEKERRSGLEEDGRFEVLPHLCLSQNSSRYSLPGIVDILNGHMPSTLLKGEGAYEVLGGRISRCTAIVVECVWKAADNQSTLPVDHNTPDCGILGFHILAVATELHCGICHHISKLSCQCICHDNHSRFSMEDTM
jgi:hypothetical protein